VFIRERLWIPVKLEPAGIPRMAMRKKSAVWHGCGFSYLGLCISFIREFGHTQFYRWSPLCLLSAFLGLFILFLAERLSFLAMQKRAGSQCLSLMLQKIDIEGCHISSLKKILSLFLILLCGVATAEQHYFGGVRFDIPNPSHLCKSGNSYAEKKYFLGKRMLSHASGLTF